MRVLLVNPPWMYKRLYTHSLYPPYGLLMVATMLARDGHDVTLLDANALDLDELQIQAEIEAHAPDALGVTVFTDTFGFLERMGPWWRRTFPGRPFVLGGPLLSGAPEPVMRGAQADVGVIGEGFLSAPQFFNDWRRLGNWRTAAAGVPGLIVAGLDGTLKRTGATPTWDAPLDDLPRPDWEMLPVRRYLAGGPSPYFQERRLQHYLSIITTLGCPWRCTFCQVPTLFEGVRRRSPESVALEVAAYRDTYQIESMYFRDDILFRPGKIADALAKEVPGLSWSCLLRADMINDREVARMKAGGCAEIRVGFESGDDAVLAHANKKTEVADNRSCVEVCRRQGVAIAGFLIVGLPGETETSLAATERFVLETGARVSVHFPLPLPGTVLYDQGRQQGFIPDEAALLRKFSEPQLPGAVLQPPPVNYTDLSPEILVYWAMRIAEAGRVGGPGLPVGGPERTEEALATARIDAVLTHADAPF